MSERLEPRVDEVERRLEREGFAPKPYRSPRLLCYGSVAELTRFVGSENMDSPFLGSSDET